MSKKCRTKEKYMTKEDAIVTNIMADGSICEDLSTYLKSPDQLPDITKWLLRMFIEDGYKILEEQRRQKQGE